MKLEVCPHCGGDISGLDDGRAGWWSFRLRLYDMTQDQTEPFVDSDADLEPDQPGRETARGLWKVAHESVMAATEYHGGEALHGLGAQLIEKKIRGLRPTISRNSGKATMRIPYDTLESFQEGREPRYMMRIDIAKVSKAGE